MTSRRFLIAVPLVLVAALWTPSVSAATSAPKSLALTLRDVQKVYGATFRPFISNTYKASARTTCGSNYSSGYLETFGNFKKGADGKGVVSVQDVVFAYPDSKSIACAAKGHGSSLASTLGAHGTKVHSSRLAGVGDSAYLVTTDTPINSGKKHAYSVMIWLARGTHTSAVTVSALGSPPAHAAAIALAKTADAHIRAGG